MKLNQRKSTHVIVNNTPIAVQYCFTKDDVAGQAPGSRRLWAIISFTHPGSRQLVRMRVSEPQSILEATEKEMLEFVEREVECYINHCDDDHELEKSRLQGQF